MRTAGIAVVAQNRFKSNITNLSATQRQDSFHFEGKRFLESTSGALAVPDQQQARRHSTGNVAGAINIAALQPKLDKPQVTPLMIF